MPPPRATQVSGSWATTTGNPVSSASRTSRSLSNAPPPVSTMPVSAMSAANSGGVCSSAFLTSWTIIASGSWSASRMSLLFNVTLRGTPRERLRPRMLISFASCCGYAAPISYLIFSAMVSPISVDWTRRT